MRKAWIPAVVLVLALVLIVGASAGGGSNKTELSFKTMVGTVAPYLGAANAIRGISGAGAPWSLDEANGKLKANGDLRVMVKGLVITATDSNPSADFRAVVSCLSSSNGAATTVNTVSEPFPATATGNAKFEGHLNLPSPCLAPIVFVTNGVGDPPGVWFSITGA